MKLASGPARVGHYRLVADGQVLTVDVQQVAQRAQEAAEELFERRRALTPAASVATDLGKEVPT